MEKKVINEGKRWAVVKKLVSLLGLLLLTAAFAACSADYDEPEQPTTRQNETPADSTVVNPRNDSTEVYKVISTVPVSDDVKQFFDEALPSLPSGFPTFSILPNENNAFLVINNEQELHNAYIGDQKLPLLDFEQNTLILGKVLMPGASFYLESVELRMYDEKNVLTVHTREPQYIYSSVYSMYFWGVFPKYKEEIDDNILVINRKDNDV